MYEKKIHAATKHHQVLLHYYNDVTTILHYYISYILYIGTVSIKNMNFTIH